MDRVPVWPLAARRRGNTFGTLEMRRKGTHDWWASEPDPPLSHYEQLAKSYAEVREQAKQLGVPMGLYAQQQSPTGRITRGQRVIRRGNGLNAGVPNVQQIPGENYLEFKARRLWEAYGGKGRPIMHVHDEVMFEFDSKDVEKLMGTEDLKESFEKAMAMPLLHVKKRDEPDES